MQPQCFHFPRHPISKPRTANMNASATLDRDGPVIVEQRGRVLIVKFNRPQVKNALNRRAIYGLMRALNDAAHNPDISIVVITGSGDAFTAGNDLGQTRDQRDLEQYHRTANVVLRALVKAVIHCPKVLVALVNGPCIGIGFTLSALCDVVYCTDGAYFQAPFTKLGICPEACSSYLLPLALGRSKATEVLLFGKKLTSEEAMHLNFVARIFKQEDLDTLFWPTMQEHSLLPSEALRASKKLLRVPEREALFNALQAECDELEKLRGGPAHLKAVELFLNRTRNNKSKL